MQYKVKKTRNSTFGNSFNIPLGDSKNSVIIICVNNGGGLQPIHLCLPHQFYEKEVKEILKEYPDTKWITVIPANSDHYVDVWDEGDQK